MSRNFLLFFIVSHLIFHKSFAQGFKQLTIDESVNGKPLVELLEDLESQYPISFIYNDEVLEGLTIFGVGRKYKIDDFLNVFLPSHKAVKLSNFEMIIVDNVLWQQYGFNASNYLTFKYVPGPKQTVAGEVLDANTLEPIIGAEVYFPALETGTLTDAEGKFRFKVDNGITEMVIRYTGFDSEQHVIGFGSLGRDVHEIYLYESSTQLENVTITAELQDRNVSSIVTGVERLGIETIKTLPTFMGEVDPIRSLTTLPGVSTVGELSAGFHVRGGENGQNLVLQDESVIYNPTHLFGFFSAFNPDMVQQVELYKGGGPANFGGRASSVLDIGLKKGSTTEYIITGGVGLISSRLGIEGPIKKGKTSFQVGGRAAYPNWLIHSLNNIQLNNSSSNFYDVTGKLFHLFNNDNFIDLTGYQSFDSFNFGNDSTYTWSTSNVSIVWDHTFNEKTSSRTIFASSNYTSNLDNDDELEGFQYRNSINNMMIKYELTTVSGENSYIYGIEGNGSLMDPGKLIPDLEESNIIEKDIQDQKSIDIAAFAHGDFKLSSKLAISAGLRASLFFRLGEDAIYSFDYDDLDGRYPSITDTTYYSGGQVISTYAGIEPRLSLRYLINENTSVKASYYRSMQYLHLISYTTSPTPQDYWIASGPYIKPEIGNQFSLGYFQNTSNGIYEYSVEGYYKLMKNSIDYIEGADITLNESLEAGLAQGDGLAYGIEAMISKKKGKFFGWASYTFSRSLRRFPEAQGALDLINDGDYYPTIHDQPHNLSLVLNYKTGKRSTLSTNFSYSSGRPITIPVSKFTYGPFLSALTYSERNEYRIPDYHRLDVSWSIQDKNLKNKKWLGEWIISVYNLYGRKNAYAIYFNQYGRAKKLSILGTILPSISYNFKF